MSETAARLFGFREHGASFRGHSERPISTKLHFTGRHPRWPDIHPKGIEMKTSKIIAATALSLLAAAAGAQAENDTGTLQVHSVRTRAEVHAEAVAAAHSPFDPNAEAALSIARPLPGLTDRSVVRAEAVAAARARNRNFENSGVVNSAIPTP
jgi:hypothetical protein